MTTPNQFPDKPEQTGDGEPAIDTGALEKILDRFFRDAGGNAAVSGLEDFPMPDGPFVGGVPGAQIGDNPLIAGIIKGETDLHDVSRWFPHDDLVINDLPKRPTDEIWTIHEIPQHNRYHQIRPTSGVAHPEQHTEWPGVESHWEYETWRGGHDRTGLFDETQNVWWHPVNDGFAETPLTDEHFRHAGSLPAPDSELTRPVKDPRAEAMQGYPWYAYTTVHGPVTRYGRVNYLVYSRLLDEAGVTAPAVTDTAPEQPDPGAMRAEMHRNAMGGDAAATN